MASPCCGASRPVSSKRKKTRKQKTRRKSDTALKNMVRLSGGTFLMGTDSNEGFAEDGEGPVREVTVDPFYLDTCAVTNADFAKFVRATAYKTEAERFGWSFVFHLFVPPSTAEHISQTVVDTPWWFAVDGACWHRPEGPGTKINNRWHHPAIHISWNDAVAYCNWARKRLPTEAEWEFAARGGLKSTRYPWGDDLEPGGKHMCNIWQGTFPEQNTRADGYIGTAPVTSFPPNNYGIYNISGNVWEWCSDWFSPTFHLKSTAKNPTGPPIGQAKSMRRRLLPVSRLLLQPIPRGRPQREHARQFHGQFGLSVCAGCLIKQIKKTEDILRLPFFYCTIDNINAPPKGNTPATSQITLNPHWILCNANTNHRKPRCCVGSD